ncbi:MAG: hypothetical protein AB1473_11580 [Thermodesulfobacteriota bacterium]
MLPSFDKYSIHARLVPAFLVLLPLGLSIVCLFPEKFAGWDFIVWLGTSSGLAVLLEQLARDQGKRKERRLFELLGGKPTTVMLRHHDSPLGNVTVQRYHTKLKSLIPNIKMPSPENERKDPSGADEVYRSCTAYLIARTRNKKAFSMVAEENANYGFRRNLWAMKPVAIVVLLISTLVASTQIHPNWLDPGKLKPIVVIALAFNLVMLLVWLSLIRPTWIRPAAEAYARQLLSACDQLPGTERKKV